jgi:release factor glutamine methyltransferase
VDKAGRRTSASDVGQSVGALVKEIAGRVATRLGGGVEDPNREARDIIAALLDVPRHWPLLHENKWVEADVWRRARAAADKRAAGAPFAYAVGRASFRNLTLNVDERVLIPRPETELLVDAVLERCAPGGVAVDVGTGSGAIAIALATEGKFDRVIATDISRDALDVARANAARNGACNVDFALGSLFQTSDVGLRTSGQGRTSEVGRRTAGVRAVVSNPPYISYDEIAELPASVRDWEPMVALLSGRGGLAITAQLVRQAAARLEPGGLLALEVDARRVSLITEVVSSEVRYEGLTVLLDLAGRERFVLATRREHE